MKFASFLHESGQELPGPVLDWVAMSRRKAARYPKPVQQPTVQLGGEG